MTPTPRLARMLTVMLAWAAVVAFTASEVDSNQTAAARPSADQWACPEEMHATFVQRFEASPGFGFARMPTTLRLDRTGVLTIDGAAFAVEQVELIGWMRRQAPVVYVSPGHGGRPILPGATREPTPWEAASAESLRAGRGIVCDPDQTEAGLRCVGPLRAKPACLQCHTDRNEGDVLGAFSYRLRAR
jgi:hypothetical protein